MHGLSQTQQYCVQEAQKHNLVQNQSMFGPNIGVGCISWQQTLELDAFHGSRQQLTTDLMP